MVRGFGVLGFRVAGWGVGGSRWGLAFPSNGQVSNNRVLQIDVYTI